MKFQKTVLILMTIFAITFAQSGCEKKDAHRGNQSEVHGTHAHHHHTAPHGGALVVLGEEFAHVEFVLEEKRPENSLVYVLDSEAEKPVRLSQKTIELKDKPVDSRGSQLLCNSKPLQTF